MAILMLVMGIALSTQKVVTAALTTNLDSVFVYPNPFDARLNHTAIVFANLTASAKIRIYKLTGELIFERDITTVDGTAVWDVTTSDHSNVASGLYIYLITNDGGQKKTGKIAILR
jgi:hypothetical protein